MIIFTEDHRLYIEGESVGFWANTFSNFLGGVAAAIVVVACYVGIQWFLRITDLTLGYNWIFDGGKDNAHNFRPSFDIRNRSQSRSYKLANIAYTRGRKLCGIDNKSVWGESLEPGSIEFLDKIAPVPAINDLADSLQVEVTVRLQNGRGKHFYIRGSGPGQLNPAGKIKNFSFRVRDWLEEIGFPLE